MADGAVSRSVLPIPDVAPVGLTTYNAKDPDTSYPPIKDVRPPAGAPRRVRRCVWLPSLRGAGVGGV